MRTSGALGKESKKHGSMPLMALAPKEEEGPARSWMVSSL